MIGLGSNRLTVCRRGGMSVTQAGRGGMEWLAGGRMPSWAQWWLPYSRQAGEALKAQFPTQWPTIRDYGFAHPEIVGYINAYAPEDAKIAYSLVEGIGKRAIKCNGSGYLDTGYVEQNLYGLEFGMRVEGNQSSWNSYIGGTRDNFTIGSNASNTDKAYIRFRTGEVTLNMETSTSEFYDYQMLNGKILVNGTQRFTTNGTPFSTASSKNIAFANNGAYGRPSKVSFTYGKLYNSSLEVAKSFVPFKRNGNMEFLDLLSGTLATRSGTFEEIITS